MHLGASLKCYTCNKIIDHNCDRSLKGEVSSSDCALIPNGGAKQHRCARLIISYRDEKNNTIEDVQRSCVDVALTCELLEKAYGGDNAPTLESCSMCDTDLCNGSTALKLSSMVHL
ncbi:uncharacterized protein LOC113386216 [Ctenocephalides felis]|uniref:uncharacterized protein LOC113386216 n=1 Tax=Ctenocephalides felis TaxID=7515 RepID=UPI000E6E4644|nr:uncharacterized protein LOC113386216 [Ctenocephalides felis]